MVLVGLALPLPGEAADWGWLGVRIRDLSEQEMEEISRRHGIREGYGVLIVEVMGETPAARSELKNGDLVVAFEGRPVVDSRTLQRLVSSTPVGENVSLTVLRGQEGRRPIAIQVGVMPREIRGERVAAEFGFSLRPASREEAPGPAGPPAVGFVLRGSQAERGGLRAGDVILEINGRRIHSPQAATQALSELSLDRPLSLTVRRGSDPLSLTLTGPMKGSP
jgi:serine protease Do